MVSGGGKSTQRGGSKPRRARSERSSSADATGLPAGLATRLIRWYEAHRRDLPWRRRSDDAYAQMIAELMLQQTQVATVIGYYERFMARFPTVGDLARADLDEVLRLWSGLGYYRRARHLHAAARRIVHDHAGVLPRDVKGLMALPGIGRYTAGAIASIAYGTRAPILDGNVVRVLMRLLAIDDDPKSAQLRTRLWQVAESALPERKCSEFNQGLMELGATLCRVGAPLCGECPLRRDCAAFARGLTDRIPSPGRRVAVRSLELVVVAVQCRDAWLFVQRPASGLWAGLWELPSAPLEAGQSSEEAVAALAGRLSSIGRVKLASVGETTRQLTHRRVRFHLWRGSTRSTHAARRKADGAREPSSAFVIAGQPARWLRPCELGSVALSSACRAILRIVIS